MTINLHGMHIMVTRPDPAGTELCKLIEDKGGLAIYFPTIAFTSPRDKDALHQALASLHQQDWMIFISPQAVYHSLAALNARGISFPPQIKLAAVGASTAKALTQAGYTVTLYPENEWSTEGLLDLPALQSIAGKHIAIVRGEGGRELLDKILRMRGAHILPVIAYQRILPTVDISKYLDVLSQHIIYVIVCMSFESIKNLQLLFGEKSWPLLKNIPLLVASKRLKELAGGLGFQTIWVAKNASHEAILEILSERGKQYDR